MPTTPPTVLIIEDSPEAHSLFTQTLGNIAIILSAQTLEEAKALFTQHSKDISIIVVDGCVPGNTLNTIPLIRMIRKTFTGPMIAASSRPAFREEMVEAGCTHQATKWKVSGKILELLPTLNS
ncbi:MAG: response regulator [Candidatus Andersenbacteria bacterium]